MSAVQEFNPAVDVLPDKNKLLDLIGELSLLDEDEEDEKIALLEAFLPVNRSIWDFLIPLMGQEAYHKRMDEVEEYTRQKRIEYVAKYGELTI
jgi:hypothetical protein